MLVDVPYSISRFSMNRSMNNAMRHANSCWLDKRRLQEVNISLFPSFRLQFFHKNNLCLFAKATRPLWNLRLSSTKFHFRGDFYRSKLKKEVERKIQKKKTRLAHECDEKFLRRSPQRGKRERKQTRNTNRLY